MIRIKRVYDAIGSGDGLRILVDRIWPRGIKRNQIDEWARDLAPSAGLRKWFGHQRPRFAQFRQLYLDELSQNPENARALLTRAADRPLTLLYAARDRQCNHAVVLGEFLSRQTGGSGPAD